MAVCSCIWRGGAWFVALLFGGVGRLGLLPGLWYWQDLNDDLVSPPISAWGYTTSGPRQQRRLYALVRLWRLAASALLLVEGGLLLRASLALDAAWVASPAF